MSTRILNVNERVQRQAKRIRQALGGASLNNVQAEAATANAGYKITRNRLAALQAGEVEPKEAELVVIAIVTGESEEFVRGVPYAFIDESHDFRASDRATPGYLNSAVELPGVPADNLNHDTTSCVDCLIDQNHLVAAEWLTPGGELPGQTRIVIDLTEAAFTYAEAV